MFNFKFPPTLCHSVIICIPSILYPSLSLTIPLTMQVNAAGAVCGKSQVGT